MYRGYLVVGKPTIPQVSYGNSMTIAIMGPLQYLPYTSLRIKSF